jgi:uncharacterized protein YbaA (DUF1428 family)
MAYVDGFVIRVPKRNLQAYPRLASMMDPKAMPFDARRMVYGGFTVLVDM